MPDEVALVGWEEIARFLGWSVSKAKSRRKAWAGILFYTFQGKPPNRHKMVFTFPSILQKWFIMQSLEGKLI
jgi:hypothetical protein